MPVPGVAVLRDAALPRRPQRLVDRQRRHGRMVAPQPLAGQDEVQVEVDEQPEQQRVGAHVDLREGVVEQDQAGRVRRGAGHRGEMRGRSSEQRQVADDLLLTLRQRSAPGQRRPRRRARPVQPHREGRPAPVVQRTGQVLGVAALRVGVALHRDQRTQHVPQPGALLRRQRAVRPAEEGDRVVDVLAGVLAQRPVQTHADALGGLHVGEQVVHALDQVGRLGPPRPQLVAELAEQVLLEQRPLPVGEQLPLTRRLLGKAYGGQRQWLLRPAPGRGPSPPAPRPPGRPAARRRRPVRRPATAPRRARRWRRPADRRTVRSRR